MRHFQPNGQCGNCQWYRHSTKTKDGALQEESHCSKEMNPKTCSEEFLPRNKKAKRMRKRAKKWARAFNC